jgi:8-oxo-dGTP pyrophosphatase MutT (NUDIX family)
MGAVERIAVIDHPDVERRARPAATVVLARDGPSGLEVLLIHRGVGTAFSGTWAFPGGVVEEVDVPPGTEPDPLPAARRAAVREALEEVGLVVDEASLVFWSHWLPPCSAPRRFSTWFFLAPAEAAHDAVGIDGTEVRDHRWITPADALAAQRAGEIELTPPAMVTLSQLAAHADVAGAVAAAAPEYFATRIVGDAQGIELCLWAGDVAYDDGVVDADGPRHRVIMDAVNGWQYLRST